MPLNNITLVTFGSWESTNLMNNNQEFGSSRLFLQILCDASRGGIHRGSGMEHHFSPVGEAGQPLDIEDDRYPLFPGRFEADLSVPSNLKNPDGSAIFNRNLFVVENTHPTVDMDYTRVWYGSGDFGELGEGDEITDSLLELYLELDYPRNIVRSYIRLAKHKLIGGDTEVAFNLLALSGILWVDV